MINYNPLSFIFHIVDLKMISQDEGQQDTKWQKVNIISMLGDDLIVVIGTMIIREKCSEIFILTNICHIVYSSSKCYI